MTTGTKDPETKGAQEVTSTAEGKTAEQHSETVAEKVTSEAEGKKAEGGKVFTQEDVNKLVGKVREESRDVTTKALLTKLGVKSEDELAALVKTADDAKKAAMSEQERLAAELEQTKAKAIELEKSIVEREADALAANIKASVVAKAAQKFVDGEAAYKLIDVASLSVNDAGDVVGVDEALNALAEKYPWMVGKKSSTTSTANPPDAETAKGKSDAARRAEYFGMQSGDFWKGGGARKIVESE